MATRLNEVLLLSTRRDIVILCGENIFCDILAGAYLAWNCKTTHEKKLLWRQSSLRLSMRLFFSHRRL